MWPNTSLERRLRRSVFASDFGLAKVTGGVAQFLVVRRQMKPVEILMLAAATLCCLNSAFGQNWTQTTAPSNYWNAVASSADGTKLVAVADLGCVFISTNSGGTWMPTSVPSNYDWSAVASLADGSKLVAAANSDADSNPGPIYTLVDSGTTWVEATNATLQYWYSVASSANGSNLVAGGYQIVSISADAGLTWTQVDNLPSGDWYTVASSADATKLVAASPGNVLYTSTNAGANWISNNVPPLVWGRVACSADGSKLVAGVGLGNLGPLYTSTDSGVAWIQQTNVSIEWWRSIASSADGNTFAAVVSEWVIPFSTATGLIYTSTNSGVTWTSNNAPNVNWSCIASSADGSKLAASIYGGGIWTSRTTPAPSLNITPTNNNLELSWIIPSTHFVLEQSSDLTTWVDLTNAPTLNLANLQNQVMLLPSNTSGVYRLATP